MDSINTLMPVQMLSDLLSVLLFLNNRSSFIGSYNSAVVIQTALPLGIIYGGMCKKVLANALSGGLSWNALIAVVPSPVPACQYSATCLAQALRQHLRIRDRAESFLELDIQQLPWTLAMSEAPWTVYLVHIQATLGTLHHVWSKAGRTTDMPGRARSIRVDLGLVFHDRKNIRPKPKKRTKREPPTGMPLGTFLRSSKPCTGITTKKGHRAPLLA